MIYYNNKDIPRNIEKSIHYFPLSSDQNFAPAQFILGMIYFENEDIPRDIKKNNPLFFSCSKTK